MTGNTVLYHKGSLGQFTCLPPCVERPRLTARIDRRARPCSWPLAYATLDLINFAAWYKPQRPLFRHVVGVLCRKVNKLGNCPVRLSSKQKQTRVRELSTPAVRSRVDVTQACRPISISWAARLGMIARAKLHVGLSAGTKPRRSTTHKRSFFY